MSNRSQSQQSDDDSDAPDVVRDPTIGEQHLDAALTAYRSRFSSGHEDSIRAIELAVCEVVDEMKDDDEGPVAVILAIKGYLHLYPTSISIHPALVRRCIEHYYK